MGRYATKYLFFTLLSGFLCEKEGANKHEAHEQGTEKEGLPPTSTKARLQFGRWAERQSLHGHCKADSLICQEGRADIQVTLSAWLCCQHGTLWR